MKPRLYASRFPRSRTMGVTTKREREREDLCVRGEEDEVEEEDEGRRNTEGGAGVGALIYVNNFHFPSAAVCITQHGPVVMAIATGQMM